MNKVKIVCDCETQTVSYVPLSADEVAELEAAMLNSPLIIEASEETAEITE